ncbi:glycosyltransferase family 39 protein [Chloroflexi bacterium TSY]|nr:glycosyltransferase family 39 protein [Chloroflexi bacterium TSY]
MELRDFDYDEGINLMKSMLLKRGYLLYSEIWSDQPPLFTALLSWTFTLFGETVKTARLLSMTLSSLLVGSIFFVVKRTSSVQAAIMAAVFLIVSEYYIRLSGAVMIGLPAMAFTMFSLAVLFGGKRSFWRVGLSGFLMACALQTKLFAGFAIPAVFMQLLIVDRDETPASIVNRIKLMIVWITSLLLVYLMIGLYFQSLNLDLLFYPHFGEQTRNLGTFIRNSTTFMPNFYRQHYAYLGFAAISVGWAFFHRKSKILLPLVWFATTWVVLSFHRPLWYHHVLQLTVPLSWLSAFCVDALRDFVVCLIPQDTLATMPFAKRTLISSCIVIGLLLITILYPKPLTARQNEQLNLNRPNFTEPALHHFISESANDSKKVPNWVFTDRPYYAFVANIPVPPPIAVLSRKRLETGIITEEIMLNVVRDYQPEHLLLERFLYTYSPAFMDNVKQTYDLMFEADQAQYYRHQNYQRKDE